MASTVTLGRLFRIRVGFHVSWIALFALVVWTIASALVDVPRLAAVLLAIVCALCLFVSVIAHEFAHALIARRFGVQTNGITLFLFGGVATLECEPPTPRAEIAIAAAGPLASAVIAALAFGAMLLVDALPTSAAASAVSLVLAYVAVANVVLAVFNVLPAFPMDGGRIVRALLWMRIRDRNAATAVASLASVTLAVCVILAALVMLGSTHAWHYAWYAALGGFVAWSGWTQLRSARLEARRAVAAAPPQGHPA